MKSRPCGWVFRLSRVSRVTRERRLPCLRGLAALVGLITRAMRPPQAQPLASALHFARLPLRERCSVGERI